MFRYGSSVRNFAVSIQHRHGPINNYAPARAHAALITFTVVRTPCSLNAYSYHSSSVYKLGQHLPSNHLVNPPLLHGQTTLITHYDESADHYDILNEIGAESLTMNERVAALLKAHSPSCLTVLDVCCGTGSQLFYLSKGGYTMTGSDINERMLLLAKQKAIESGFCQLVSRLHLADMRTVRLGEFDAVISMFNAVGHLTRTDFELTMRNIGSNLNPGGIFIFDIINVDYLRHGKNISKLTIDWIRRNQHQTVRKIQYSDIDADGILTSFTVVYKTNLPQSPSHPPSRLHEPERQPETDTHVHSAVSSNVQTLQVYGAEELVAMLSRAGLRVLQQCGINGEQVSKTRTPRIFTTAKLLD